MSDSLAATAPQYDWQLDRPRILIVEHRRAARQKLESLLALRCEVATARTPQQALECLNDKGVHTVLVALRLPNSGAIGFVKALRESPNCCAVPVVLYSRHADKTLLIDSLELGANDYLTQPFDPREVLARVDAYVQLDQLRRRNRHLEQQSSSSGRELNSMSAEYQPNG